MLILRAAIFHDVEHLKEEVVVIGGGSNGEMGDFEARKLWAAVAKGIRDGDFETASKEKAKIEVSHTLDICCPLTRHCFPE